MRNKPIEWLLYQLKHIELINWLQLTCFTENNNFNTFISASF